MRPSARHWILSFALALAVHVAAGWLWGGAPRGGGPASGGGGPVRLVLGAPAGAQGIERAAQQKAAAAAPVYARPPRRRPRPPDTPAIPPPPAPPAPPTTDVASATVPIVPATRPSAAGAPPAATGRTPAPGGSGSGSDRHRGDGLGSGDDYLTGVVAKVSAALRYPSHARRRGVRGEVLVRVRIDRRGALQDARVLRGSGSPLLDRDALRTVRRAAPFGRVPTDFPSSELDFEIPIQYALE